MTVLCDSLGSGFPTYPEFVLMLRAYERPRAAVNRPVWKIVMTEDYASRSDDAEGVIRRYDWTSARVVKIEVP